jgi:hypothetical protein
MSNTIPIILRKADDCWSTDTCPFHYLPSELVVKPYGGYFVPHD